ncbi:MAG: hypothetical protein PSV13_11710 [Lacunisphaera sp.]|nr:hypothetical protein [Lacunisphaera sp.]
MKSFLKVFSTEANPLVTRKPSLHLWLGIVLVGMIHLCGATWHIRFGATNTDEGFYAITTRAVAQGELPYRDFGFTQPPFVLYANALPLKLAGFGLTPMRIVNGVWAALGLALAAYWVARRTNAACGLGLAVLFSINAPWMYFMHMGKTYGFTTLLVVLAMWTFLALKPGTWRAAALGLLVVVGIGTRLTAAPFFVLLWLLALWPGRRPATSELVAAVASVGLATIVLLLPFWWAAPEQVRFWVFDFHRLSLGARKWDLGWQDWVSIGPGVWVLAAFAMLVLRSRWKSGEAGVFLAAGLTLAVNLLPTGAYDEYGMPFLMPLAASSVVLLNDASRTWSRGFVVAVVGLATVAQVAVTPWLTASDRPDVWSRWLTPRSSPYDYGLPGEMALAREIVWKELKADAPFIGPHLLLAAETGRAVPRELYMGAFAFTAEMPADRAARLHLVTHERLEQWFDDPQVTVLGFFPRLALDYGWSMPSYAQIPDDAHMRWFGPVWRQFRIAYKSENFVVLVRKQPAVGEARIP